MSKANTCAVVTGDLIKSRQASSTQVEDTLHILHDAAVAFGAAWDMDLRFTRFRGDGWQVVLTRPQLLLDGTLYLIARMKAQDTPVATRISIGVGPVETVGSKDLSDGTGTAFFVSGDQLGQMGRNRIIALGGPRIDAAQIAIMDLAECIATGWTRAQAEAMAIHLEGKLQRHEDIAARLGVTRQAIQSRLASAGLPYFENAFYAMRHHDFGTPT